MATVRDSTWVADTGASFHVTPQRDFFSSYTTGDYGYVRMGNGQSCKIVGIGDVCLETELGCKLFLKKVWTGKKVSYKHLRVFGCRVSVHIPRDERSKLDAEAKQCIFLGYAHEEFEYRFWDPDSKKIIRSRDVVFFEDQTIDDLQKLEKARVGNPHEISIPVPVDVEHPVEEVPGEYEETTTGGEIPQ
ncbi:hypothetical protein CRG98_014902, partial [Punica granatum]